MRDFNLSLVLHEIFHVGGCSRSRLCRATGLTAGAVTLLVNELGAAGLIETAAATDAEGGRRKKQLALARCSYPVAVIELAPGALRLRCEALSGEVLIEEERPAGYQERPIEDFAADVADLLAEGVELLGGEGVAPLRAAGLVTPSPVLSDRSTILGNLETGWGVEDLGAQVRDALAARGLSMPVALLKDADCAAAFEYHLLARGEGPAPRGLLYMTSDGSIGGAYVVEGRVYNGPLGTAMTIGHIQLDPEGELCACGKRGCLETLAGAEALFAKSGLAELAREEGREAAVAELRERWLAGDEQARAVVGEALRYIRVAIEVALTLLTADCVVLGGYLAEYLDEILAVPNGFTSLGVPGATRLLAGQAGSDAAILGGALRMREALLDHAGELMRDEPLDAASLVLDTL